MSDMVGGSRKRPRPKHLAKKLKAIRLSLGLSQPEFAKRFAGIQSPPDGAMISRFERGIREPSLVAIVRYAKIAGITTDLILDDSRTVSDLKRAMK